MFSREPNGLMTFWLRIDWDKKKDSYILRSLDDFSKVGDYFEVIGEGCIKILSRYHYRKTLYLNKEKTRYTSDSVVSYWIHRIKIRWDDPTRTGMGGVSHVDPLPKLLGLVRVGQ